MKGHHPGTRPQPPGHLDGGRRGRCWRRCRRTRPSSRARRRAMALPASVGTATTSSTRGRVPERGQVADADALDVVRPRLAAAPAPATPPGSTATTLDARVVVLQGGGGGAAQAGPAVPTACTKASMRPSVCRQISSPSSKLAGDGVRVLRKLVRRVGARLPAQAAGGLYHLQDQLLGGAPALAGHDGEARRPGPSCGPASAG